MNVGEIYQKQLVDRIRHIVDNNYTVDSIRAELKQVTDDLQVQDIQPEPGRAVWIGEELCLVSDNGRYFIYNDGSDIPVNMIDDWEPAEVRERDEVEERKAFIKEVVREAIIAGELDDALNGSYRFKVIRKGPIPAFWMGGDDHV